MYTKQDTYLWNQPRELTMNNKMKLHIPAHIYAEIDYYVQHEKDEISGLGRIVQEEDGTMRVTKVYLIKQENGPTTTDLDEDAVAKLLFDSREDEGDMNFWWHSHNDMKAFWSGTDHDTIKDLGKNGFIVATVFNHARDHRTAYFQGADGFKPEVFIDNIPTSFHAMYTQEECDKYDKNIKDCVVKRTYGNGFPNYYSGNNYSNHYDGWSKGKTWDKENKKWVWPYELKEGKKSGKQQTLLGEESENESKSSQNAALVVEDLYDLVSAQEASQWEALWMEANDFTIYQVHDEDVLQFYVRNDGDFQSATTEAYSIIAENQWEEAQRAGV